MSRPRRLGGDLEVQFVRQIRFFLVLLPLLLVLLVGCAWAEEFADWRSGPDSQKTILAKFGSDKMAAKGYLDQIFGLEPDFGAKTLKKLLADRQKWCDLAVGHRDQLQLLLGDSDPWMRYFAAILSGPAHMTKTLRHRLEVEQHRDVRHALEAGLAQAGDDAEVRLRRLVQEERLEKSKKASGRAVELRCIYLIDLVYSVHRPELMQLAQGLIGDDGALGETIAGDSFYQRAHLKFLRESDRCILGLGPNPLRVVRDGSIPQLQGHPDAKLQQSINRTLRQSCVVPKRPPGYREMRDFEVKRLDAMFLSILFRSSGIAAGAGSHTRQTSAISIDLRTGKMLELRDLFRNGTDWMSQLQKLVPPLLEEKYPGKVDGGWSQRPLKFYLRSKNLVLTDLLGDGSGFEIEVSQGLRELIEPGSALWY